MCVYLSLCQLVSELLHLLSQLSDDASVGVLVHHGMIDDALGAVGVAEGRQRLLVVVSCGAHRGNHRRATVATQAVLSDGKHKQK